PAVDRRSPAAEPGRAQPPARLRWHPQSNRSPQVTTTTWPQLSFPRVERPLKLFYLLPAEAFGGAERQGIEHIRRLPDHGVEVTPLVGPGDVAIRALEAAGVRRYVYVPDFPRTGRARPAWAGTVGDWLEWFKASRRSVHSVLREAARTHFDLVFANRTIAWPLAGLDRKSV